MSTLSRDYNDRAMKIISFLTRLCANNFDSILKHINFIATRRSYRSWKSINDIISSGGYWRDWIWPYLHNFTWILTDLQSPSHCRILFCKVVPWIPLYPVYCYKVYFCLSIQHQPEDCCVEVEDGQKNSSGLYGIEENSVNNIFLLS